MLKINEMEREMMRNKKKTVIDRMTDELEKKRNVWAPPLL